MTNIIDSLIDLESRASSLRERLKKIQTDCESLEFLINYLREELAAPSTRDQMISSGHSDLLVD